MLASGRLELVDFLNAAQQLAKISLAAQFISFIIHIFVNLFWIGVKPEMITLYYDYLWTNIAYVIPCYSWYCNYQFFLEFKTTHVDIVAVSWVVSLIIYVLKITVLTDPYVITCLSTRLTPTE
jgi:small-conductance mechanosensitive channel